jgi:hypothetical protein
MLSYLLLTISSIFIGRLFYKIDAYNVLKEYLIIKKEKLNRLYNLVATRHTSSVIITFISIEMLVQAFYQSLVQYLDNSITKVGKNKYELKYVINGKLYKKIITPERGPLPVIFITNETNEDVTEQILPYIGPNNDFHNEKFYPSFFGYKKLIFEMLNGESRVFYNLETITI